MRKLLGELAIGAAILGLSGVTVILEAQTPLNHDVLVTANRGAKRIMVQADDDFVTINSTSFSSISSDFLTIPATQSGRVVITFSAESRCTGAAGQWLYVRVLVDGSESFPQSDPAFDSGPAGGQDDFWETNSLTRVSQQIGPGGSHSIELQARTTSGALTCTLDDWVLLAEFWRV